MQATEHATQYQNMAKQSKSTAKTHTTSWCSRLGPHRTSLSWIPSAWAFGFTNVRASARAGCSYGRWLPGFRLCVGRMENFRRSLSAVRRTGTHSKITWRTTVSCTNMHRYTKRSDYRTARHPEKHRKEQDDKHKRRDSKSVWPGQKSNKHREKHIFTAFRVS